ncbi:MAG TPA: serine/threonine-protein kinase [Actinophytocola sp.]|uniref:serine/threonine-protein kinase n=1 Tax=Actinophytocola sp. TaxID=1872138 RepID=UPI002F947C34
MTVVAGRYRLLTRIGQGGMGVVWRAHDELLRRDIAVKELHVRLGVDSDFHTKQVLREARAAAQLRHPGVVAVHDVVVDDGRPLILMELVGGRSLADVVRDQGPLPEQRVAEIGARVLEALSMAHARGVVHRDVKPANILLDGERVVLTDFGIAAITSDTTGSDTMVGSLDYMAPERVNGQRVTPASDVWSLGVTLCAALRGESPFQRSDTQATLAAVLTYDPAPIARAPRLWRVLEMMLRKDPRQRPTAAAASALLAAIVNVPPGRSEPRNGIVVAPPIKPVVRPPVEPPGRLPGKAVVEPETAHVVEPLRDSTTGARARGARMTRPLVVLLAVLVLIAAGGIWLIMRPGDVAGTATSAAASVDVPSGFTAHRGDGFTIAIPRGWFKDPSEQEIYWVSDPHSPRLVLAHLEWWDDAPPGGAYRELTDLEKGDFLDVKVIQDYKRLRLARLPAPRGTTRAEMEMTYHVDEDGGYNLHDLSRAFVTTGGRTYILTISSQGNNRAETERLWRTKQDDLKAILASFRLTSP